MILRRLASALRHKNNYCLINKLVKVNYILINYYHNIIIKLFNKKYLKI
jgi:hypothetical protein